MNQIHPGLAASMDSAHAHANQLLDSVLDTLTVKLEYADSEKRVVMIMAALGELIETNGIDTVQGLCAAAVNRLIDARLQEQP